MRIIFGLVLLLLGIMPGLAQPAFQAGVIRLPIADERPFEAIVWYPTREAEAPFQAGPYPVQAKRDAVLAAGGKFPVVLLSHGSGGVPMGHRELAASLAREGFVVVAPLHIGDSAGRTERREAGYAPLDRPHQAKKALDKVLGDPRFVSRIDENRMAGIGFSAGGYTALVLAGAKPDFLLWPVYCRENMEDRELCAGVSLTRFPGVTETGWQAPHEPRLKALVLMAPLGIPFTPEALRAVKVPVLFYEAEKDVILRRPVNAERIVRGLSPAPDYHVVAGGHFVFLDPCPVSLATEVPAICADAPGVDRVGLHRRLEAEIADFLKKQLPASVQASQ